MTLSYPNLSLSDMADEYNKSVEQGQTRTPPSQKTPLRKILLTAM